MSIYSRIYNNRNNVAKLFIISLIVAPAIIALLFIIRNGINAVIGDQWFFIPLFQKLYSGNLTIADLFAQQNEHRLFLPRVVMLALGTITQDNTKFEMYFSWLVICLSCIVIYRIFKITPALNRMSIAWFIPVTWIIFTLRQFDNLLTGFQVQHFLVVLFFLFAVYLLQICKGLDWRLGAAILSAIAGSFSMANGLLIWPIGFLQILLICRSKRKDQQRSYMVAAAIWLLIAVTTYIVYFATFQNAEHVVQQPLESFVYLMAALGNSFYSYPNGAVVVGSILLILFIYAGVAILFDSKNRPDNVPFLALMLFSGATAVMLVLGRPEFSVLSRKYITMPIVGVTGLYLALLSLKLKFINPKSLIFRSLIILMVIFILLEDWSLSSVRITLNREFIPYYTYTYQFQSDETLTKAECIPLAIRQGCRVLSDYKLNVFSQPVISLNDLKKSDGEAVCIIESVNGSILKEGEISAIKSDEKEKAITITGWAIDKDNGKAAGGVVLVIDGNTEIPAYYGIHRLDVVEYHKNNNYLYSGFYASMANSVLGPGRHTIAIKVISADKKEYYQAPQTLYLDLDKQNALIAR